MRNEMLVSKVFLLHVVTFIVSNLSLNVQMKKNCSGKSRVYIRVIEVLNLKFFVSL